MKKRYYHLLVAAIVFLLPGIWYRTTAQSSLLDQALDDTAAFSRFELSWILEQMRCEDCLQPSALLRTTYTENRLNAQPGLEDISFEEAPFNDEDYYYCVAESVDRGYIAGYNPDDQYCANQFCGSNLVTYADVFPALSNLVSEVIYPAYSVNRSQIQSWAERSGSLSAEKKSEINQRADSCASDCVLQSPDEFALYLDYCTANMGSCGFQSFPSFPPNNPVTIAANVLIRHAIVDRDEMSEITPDDLVLGEAIKRYATAIQSLMECDFVDDYDRDGVKNSIDVCPDVFDPYQKDFDGDGIGDICDTDIDNDGRLNPEGVVDYNGRVIRSKLVNSDDQFVYDTDDEDAAGAYALAIGATPDGGISPESITFEAKFSGTIDSIEWRFGDGYGKTGGDVSHTYTEPGRYNVVAMGYYGTQKVAVATMSLEILPGPNVQIGYQILSDEYLPDLGDEILLSHIYAGQLQQVTREIGTELQNVAPDEVVEYTMTDAGLYYIESQAYNAFGERVGLSQLTLDVIASGGAGSALIADSLTPGRNELVTVRTTYEGFTEDDIDQVLRDYGDGVAEENTSLTMRRAYQSAGAKIVQQIITFKDQTLPPHENVLTLYVTEPGQPASVELEVDPLTVGVGGTTTCEAIITGDFEGRVRKVERSIGRVQRVYDGFSRDMLLQDCSFSEPGSQSVRVIFYLDDGTTLSAQTTVGVTDDDICATDLSDAGLCDLDGDSIPDICDEDIDGDGVPNSIGAVPAQEEGNCQYDPDDVRDELPGSGNDSCILIKNPDQADQDGDGIGDACDSEDNSTPPTDSETGTGSGAGDGSGDGGDNGGGNDGSGDSDGDGIPDSSDGCPGVPESGNGSQDGDGCPELPGSDGDTGPGSEDDGPFIQPETCTMCPCPYADYSSAIRKLDRITAELRDESGTIKYRTTAPVIIERDIPDEMLGG